ncbi:MAG: TolC family protein [Vicinamibacteria bacterium]|nr:TolC family protein [Vicinamibacteria bacterium]
MFPTAIALALALAAGPASPAQDPTPSPTPSPVIAPAGPVLALTVDEAVQRALENNADLAVEKFTPQGADLSISDAKSVYDPVVLSTISTQSRTSKSTNTISGGAQVETDTITYNFAATKAIQTGGAFRVDFNNNRQKTNSTISAFNPNFNSNFNANFTQPLLKNRSIDSNRLNIKLTKRNKEITDLQFRSIVVSTLANVRKLYYDLIYAVENLSAQRKSLTLAQKFLNENQIKVNVGTLAPLDVVAAESEVATREEGVVIAENALAEAQDAIKRAILPKNDPEAWKMEIVAKDRPTAQPVPVDAESAINNALQKRIDFQVLQKNLQNVEDQVALAKQGRKPSLDLFANYGTLGTGGTQLIDLTTNQKLANPIPGGYGDALSEVVGRDYPTWNVGVNFTYPIFNRVGKNSAARGELALEQYRAVVRRAELQIANEVRTASRAVETNFKRVATTQAARTLQQRRLDAEEKKFAAGMSTNFLVTQAQRDLALAEVAEIRAIADYNKSLVDFERVQEAGLSGGNGLITVR